MLFKKAFLNVLKRLLVRIGIMRGIRAVEKIKTLEKVKVLPLLNLSIEIWLSVSLFYFLRKLAWGLMQEFH